MEARLVDRPAPGFFKVRLHRRGIWCPARIWLDDDPRDPLTGESIDRAHKLMAEIDGKPADPMQVWHWGKPIHVTEYNYMRGVTEWAITHAPNDPAANPKAPVDLNAMPPLF